MKTAVEWLMDKYRRQNGIITAGDYHTAKELEKQQIVKAFDDGFETFQIGIEYYNETFKNA